MRDGASPHASTAHRARAVGASDASARRALWRDAPRGARGDTRPTAHRRRRRRDPAGSSAARAGRLLSRLTATEKALIAARDTLAHAAAAGTEVSPAGAWLLDNFFVVLEQVPEIRATLPAGYYQELPKLAGDGDARRLSAHLRNHHRADRAHRRTPRRTERRADDPRVPARDATHAGRALGHSGDAADGISREHSPHGTPCGARRRRSRARPTRWVSRLLGALECRRRDGRAVGVRASRTAAHAGVPHALPPADPQPARGFHAAPLVGAVGRRRRDDRRGRRAALGAGIGAHAARDGQLHRQPSRRSRRSTGPRSSRRRARPKRVLRGDPSDVYVRHDARDARSIPPRRRTHRERRPVDRSRRSPTAAIVAARGSAERGRASTLARRTSAIISSETDGAPSSAPPDTSARRGRGERLGARASRRVLLRRPRAGTLISLAVLVAPLFLGSLARASTRVVGRRASARAPPRGRRRARDRAPGREPLRAAGSASRASTTRDGVPERDQDDRRGAAAPRERRCRGAGARASRGAVSRESRSADPIRAAQRLPRCARRRRRRATTRSSPRWSKACAR